MGKKSAAGAGGAGAEASAGGGAGMLASTLGFVFAVLAVAAAALSFFTLDGVADDEDDPAASPPLSPGAFAGVASS